MIRNSTAMSAVLLAAAVVVAPIGATKAAPGAKPPPQARAVGYGVNTFHSVFNPSTVDMSATPQPGYQWYPTHFYWMKPTNSDSMKLSDGDTIVLSSDGTPSGNNNTQICSMSPSKLARSGFVGKSFGGGGYFEATFSFDPDVVFSQRKKGGETQKDAGWPSWWSLSVDPIVERSIVQSWNYYSSADVDPKYCNSVEADFFEYNNEPNARDQFGATLHNWYGLYKYKAVNYPYEAGLMKLPQGTDFTKPHKYGFLWVPARASGAGKVRGYAAYYFDDKLVGGGRSGSQTWEPYCGEAPPPTIEKPAFGVLDRQHLALILGSGVSEPMKVYSVNVWQTSDAWNLGADTLYDIFIDLKKAATTSGSVGIKTATPELFDGHARRLGRTGPGTASITYAVAGVKSFAVQVFERKDVRTKLGIEVSSDQVKWETVKTNSRTVLDSHDHWGCRDIVNASSLPKNAGYFRISFTGETPDLDDCQIGQIRIN